MRSESTSSECFVHHIHLTRDHSPTLFLEYHCVVSDLSITFNAFYSTPGHTDTSGDCGGSHITRGSGRATRIKDTLSTFISPYRLRHAYNKTVPGIIPYPEIWVVLGS